MGAIYPNYMCWAKGKAKDSGEWVYGNYVQMLIDSSERPHIYPFPRNPNSGNHAYTPDSVEVERDSIRRYIGLTDFNGDTIYEKDVVKIPTGQTGQVCYELGTWGIAIIEDTIDWENLEDIAESSTGNNAYFLYNDNFISFYELIDNCCPEDAYDSQCSAVCILTDGKPAAKEYDEYWLPKESE